MRGAWVKVLGMLLLLFVGALPGAKGQQYSRLQTSAPLSVEYENYLMAEGWLGVGEVEKLSDPRSFFNGIMPGSERADEIADTLGRQDAHPGCDHGRVGEVRGLSEGGG